VSCMNHNRRVIGLEIKPEYCDIAARRIGRALSDKRSKLFA
jgi:DNA modification methylase